MAGDAVRERQPRGSIRSVHQPALAVAEDAPGLAVERDLKDLVRLERSHVEAILAEADVPQPLVRDRRERRDAAVQVDLQHAVVAKIHRVEIALAVEGDAVRTLEQITRREGCDRAVRRNLRDGIAAAVGYEHFAGLAVDRNADGSAQPVSARISGAARALAANSAHARIDAALRSMRATIASVSGRVNRCTTLYRLHR